MKYLSEKWEKFSLSEHERNQYLVQEDETKEGHYLAARFFTSQVLIIRVAKFEVEEGEYDSFSASDDDELNMDKASASSLVLALNSDTFIEQVVAGIERRRSREDASVSGKGQIREELHLWVLSRSLHVCLRMLLLKWE
ncbi:hypothetical protein SO802_010440 [Lithocarpus litseifolius]|uniref:Uncharacterized protein n=1 Tax=Lithocarpus litseifolius TaxID=425828 RepID=A0AAW2DGV9_9ROSI